MKQKKIKKLNLAANIVNIIIKWRFIIAIIVFGLCVALKIHGSSIGMWDDIVKEKINPKEETVIMGKNRPIRSDEWLVQSTYYFAQSMSEEYYPLINKNVTTSGQNMIMSYNAPVSDITVIGKPFNWGFLILGKEYGLSWYWAFKMIGLILLSYELAMILTRKNKVLSLVSAFWITYSPAVQWWFMQHVGDLVFFTIAIIVSFYKYFQHHSSINYRIINSIIFISSAIGFALVIYPALQVPFAYLIIVFMILIYLKFRKNSKLNKADYVLMTCIVAIIFSVLVYFIYTSYDAIVLSLNTIYPGKRVSLGGEIELFQLSSFMLNTYIPFRDFTIGGLNNCEISSFINFFIGSSIILFVSMRKKKVDTVGVTLFVLSTCQLVWCFFKFPKWFAKITFLSYVPSARMSLMFNFTAMLFSIWAIGLLFREKLFSKKSGLVIAIINLTFYVVLILSSYFVEYISMKWYGILFLIYLVINVSLFCKLKRVFYISMMMLIMLSGMTVNPLAHGVGSIYNKTLSKAIIDISKEDPNGVWVTEGGEINGSYVYANGAKVFNGIQFYPDMDKWKEIDNEYKDAFYYNRYAHVRVDLIDSETNYNLNGLDSITVNMNLDDLPKANIKYVITTRNLQREFLGSSIEFEKIYNSDVDGIKIYKVLY